MISALIIAVGMLIIKQYCGKVSDFLLIVILSLLAILNLDVILVGMLVAQFNWLELLGRLDHDYGGKFLLRRRVGSARAFCALLGGHVFKSEIEYIFRFEDVLSNFSVSESAAFAEVTFVVVSSSSGIS